MQADEEQAQWGDSLKHVQLQSTRQKVSLRIIGAQAIDNTGCALIGGVLSHRLRWEKKIIILSD
jgi:hypothetical protein